MFTKLKLFIFGVGAALLGLVQVVTYWRGRSDEAAADEAEELGEYKETRERIDDVEISDDPDVLRDLLRERGKR